MTQIRAGIRPVLDVTVPSNLRLSFLFSTFFSIRQYFTQYLIRQLVKLVLKVATKYSKLGNTENCASKSVLKSTVIYQPG